jgi:hypothetical protein
MNDAIRPDRTDLPMAILERVDRIRGRFETDRTRGARPRIEDYLGSDDPQRSDVLLALLTSEIDARLRRGELPEPSEYRGRFCIPGDSGVIKAAFAGSPNRSAVVPPGSGPAISTAEEGGRGQPASKVDDPGEATRNAVNPLAATVAGDHSSDADLSIAPTHDVETEAGETRADQPRDALSADFALATSAGRAPAASTRVTHLTLPGY